MASRTRTRRQTEIAALLAYGLTNETIARWLAISPSTVSTHVQQLLWRLDLTSRDQLTAFVKNRRIGVDEDPSRPGGLSVDVATRRPDEHDSIRSPGVVTTFRPSGTRGPRTDSRPAL
jgi:DNA-binding CsgD family transcriptional regulator